MHHFQTYLQYLPLWLAVGFFSVALLIVGCACIYALSPTSPNRFIERFMSLFDNESDAVGLISWRLIGLAFAFVLAGPFTLVVFLLGLVWAALQEDSHSNKKGMKK